MTLIYVGFNKLEDGHYGIPMVCTESLDQIQEWLKQDPKRAYTVLTIKSLDK